MFPVFEWSDFRFPLFVSLDYLLLSLSLSNFLYYFELIVRNMQHGRKSVISHPTFSFFFCWAFLQPVSIQPVHPTTIQRFKKLNTALLLTSCWGIIFQMEICDKYSHLLRCSTAWGSRAGFFRVSPTKVEAPESFPFTESSLALKTLVLKTIAQTIQRRIRQNGDVYTNVHLLFPFSFVQLLTR